ncbi:MAG: hypothetical protein GY880_31275 [Planctomycetaceae bacterium]|nr:hypothetical protein [Planctomycetaceae bacterium]
MASYAASNHDKTGTDPVIPSGSRGQIDVYVGKQMVVTRKGGLLALHLKKPWPSVSSVVEAIKRSIKNTPGLVASKCDHAATSWFSFEFEVFCPFIGWPGLPESSQFEDMKLCFGNYRY